MELGFIGLGRMGKNMVLRLLGGGHRVIAYNRSPGPVREVAEKGAISAGSLKELVEALTPPRALWVMVPAGGPTDGVIGELGRLCTPGDVVVDGGNSYYKDSIRHGQELAARGIQFLDAGTSGGIWGLQIGYCLMVGGEEAAFRRLEPALRTLAPPDGCAHLGPVGAGHFTKMVHNGIEYGMMEAYAEGFELLKASGYPLDLARIAHLWNQGSVVRSWLLELAERAFRGDPDLAGIEGYVEDSGEGRWTVQESIERGVPAPVIALALQARFRSRQPDSFAARFLAALRGEFGGHPVRLKEAGSS